MRTALYEFLLVVQQGMVNILGGNAFREGKKEFGPAPDSSLHLPQLPRCSFQVVCELAQACYRRERIR